MSKPAAAVPAQTKSKKNRSRPSAAAVTSAKPSIKKPDLSTSIDLSEPDTCSSRGGAISPHTPALSDIEVIIRSASTNSLTGSTDKWLVSLPQPACEQPRTAVHAEAVTMPSLALATKGKVSAGGQEKASISSKANKKLLARLPALRNRLPTTSLFETAGSANFSKVSLPIAKVEPPQLKQTNSSVAVKPARSKASLKSVSANENPNTRVAAAADSSISSPVIKLPSVPAAKSMEQAAKSAPSTSAPVAVKAEASAELQPNNNTSRQQQQQTLKMPALAHAPIAHARTSSVTSPVGSSRPTTAVDTLFADVHSSNGEEVFVVLDSKSAGPAPEPHIRNFESADGNNGLLYEHQQLYQAYSQDPASVGNMPPPYQIQSSDMSQASTSASAAYNVYPKIAGRHGSQFVISPHQVGFDIQPMASPMMHSPIHALNSPAQPYSPQMVANVLSPPQPSSPAFFTPPPRSGPIQIKDPSGALVVPKTHVDTGPKMGTTYYAQPADYQYHSQNQIHQQHQQQQQQQYQYQQYLYQQQQSQNPNDHPMHYDPYHNAGNYPQPHSEQFVGQYVVPLAQIPMNTYYRNDMQFHEPPRPQMHPSDELTDPAILMHLMDSPRPPLQYY